MDIIEFAEKYFSDDDGKGIKLYQWQKDILQAWERGDRIIICPPRTYGRAAIKTIIDDYSSRVDGT